MAYGLMVIPHILLTQFSTLGSGHPEEMRKPLGITFIPYVKGISECRCIGDCYNIKTVIKTKHTHRDMLMRSGQARSSPQMADCICSIPCECGEDLHWRNG
jgi:hypothetical protein